MSRTLARYPLLVLATLIPLAAGCGRSDQPKTTSASAGATPHGIGRSRETHGRHRDRIYETAESVFGAGRYPEAVELFAAYTATHPENPWGHYMLGMAAWKAGDQEKALERLRPGTPARSESPEEPVQLQPGVAGDRPPERGPGADREGARAGADVERRTAPAWPGAVRARQMWTRRSRPIAGRSALDERDVWSMNNLGLIYIQQDRSSEALAPLARAVELRSNAPVFQNNLGTALERVRLSHCRGTGVRSRHRGGQHL